VEVWELLVREQVRTTLTNYSTAGDGGQMDDLIGLFTEDAVMEVTPQPPATGRDAIRDLLMRLSTTFEVGELLPGQKPILRHFTTNVHFRSLAPDRAETTSYFCAMTTTGADHWGRYFDVLVPAGDRWLFSHRIAKTEGWEADGWHAHNRKLAVTGWPAPSS
jgi:hypothetical protein